jgi:predicted  nucleic acid-binding Zn-ribbon protein
MSEISNQPTAADRLQELQQLNQQREGYLRQQAVIQSKHQQAGKDLESLKKEMIEVGTSPETVEADITRLRQELNQATAKYREDLNECGKAIEIAEANLTT